MATETLPPVIRSGLERALAGFVQSTTAADRIDGFVGLMEWLRAGGDPASDPFARGVDRLAALADAVDGDAGLRVSFHRAVGAMVSAPAGENLFGETGVPDRGSFTGELVRRLLAYVLPAPRDDHELGRLLRRVFQRERDVASFADLPPARFARLVDLLFPADRPELSAAIAASFADGFRLLATRVQAEGLGEDLRARSRGMPVADSPFLRLSRATDAVLDAWQAGSGLAGPAAAWRSMRAACRSQLTEVRRHLESEGVSVDIVFGLEVIDRCLGRMSLMLEAMAAPAGAPRAEAIHRLLTGLIAASHEDRGVGHLIAWHLRLLGRKMVDRGGETGEQYIAYSREEYRRIWWAAAGGGLLIAAVVAVTLTIAGAGLALFQEGLLTGIAYAIGFLLLQAFSLLLATKQPPMTGAALAAVFRERHGAERLDEIVDFTARICHSQVAAAAGNVALVVVGGIGLEAAWRAVSGHPFLPAAQAAAVQHSFNPLSSGTIFHAALTGVILWLAGLVGGWFDNWSAVHRLPLAIREHPLGRHVGHARLARLYGVWARNAAGIGTSVSLGLMLGLAPVLGHFFGVPLDVRHVTLAAGQLALSTAALWPDGVNLWALYGLAGVALTFALNLAVSYVLTFFSAARAYGLPASDVAELTRRLAQRVLTRPAEFVLPARTPFRLPADHVNA